MFTYPRSAWVPPAPPITGPAANWSTIDTVVIHYTAADDLIDGDPGENADGLDDYMRAMQSSYVRTRGYSLGYNVAVDYRGHTWEIRGWDIRCAANKGHNDHTFAILMLVDGADPANPAQVAAANALIAEAQRRAGRPVTVIGHGQLAGAATACPGAGLRAQIAGGVFGADVHPIPPTTEDDVKVLPEPQRPYDSRVDNNPLEAGDTRTIPVTIAQATAVAVNLTVVDPAGDGYLVAWGKGTRPPGTANVTFDKGRTISNHSLVPVDGTAIRIMATQRCHVVVDVQGVQ